MLAGNALVTLLKRRADAVGFDWLNLILGLARPVVDTKAAANHRLPAAKEAGAAWTRRPGERQARREVGLQRFVNSCVRWQDLPVSMSKTTCRSLSSLNGE